MIKIVLMGDLGDPTGYHAGDEAMAEAAVRELAARTDLTVTAVSGNPVDTRARYGWDAVPRFGFADVVPAVDRARDARLRAILDGAGGDSGALDSDDPAWKIIQAVAAADAVLVTGGGNLNSSWPEHVYERAALTGVAAALSRLLVVSGQTIGPTLTRRHGELVGRTVTSARLVAVREAASFEVARALGVLDGRLALTVDDATFLDGDAVDDLPAPMVAVTFASHTGLLNRPSFLSCAARLLERTVDVTGLDIVMVPHQGLVDETGARGDVA
ncbi:MAG TPA: polysaccharide pyruvyl transferase family protein, partial [Acidimicrobiales bacterium]